MLTIVIGTNRPDSVSRKIGEVLRQAYQCLDAEPNVIDLIDLPPELALPSAYDDKPPAFKPVARQVVASAGLVVVTPEYNGSFPGILKLFVDHLPFPDSFERKPVCFVGVSGGTSGGVRGVEQMQQIFGYRNAHLYPERVFLPLADELFGADGRLRDAGLTRRLERQAAGFRAFVDALRRPVLTSV